MAFLVSIGCFSFARYCGKMYSRHLLLYDQMLQQKFYLSSHADHEVLWVLKIKTKL